MHLPFIPDDLALAVAAFGEASVGARLLEIRRHGGGSAAAITDASACASAEPRRVSAEDEPAHGEPAASATPLRDAIAADLERMRSMIAESRKIAGKAPRPAWADDDNEGEQ